MFYKEQEVVSVNKIVTYLYITHFGAVTISFLMFCIAWSSILCFITDKYPGCRTWFNHVSVKPEFINSVLMRKA